MLRGSEDIRLNRMKVMTRLRLLQFYLLFIPLQSCIKDSDNLLTLVKGKVTDQITNEAVSGIPIHIIKCDNRNFMMEVCDSLKATLTDSNGLYETSFNTESGYYYKIGVWYTERYNGTDIHRGPVIQEGLTNTFDFAQLPYRIMKVSIQTNKNSRNYLDIHYRSWGDGGEWLSGTILHDTLTSRQDIDTTVYVRVFPRSRYRIDKFLSLRQGTNSSNFTYTNHVYTLPRYALTADNDTTTIVLN